MTILESALMLQRSPKGNNVNKAITWKFIQLGSLQMMVEYLKIPKRTMKNSHLFSILETTKLSNVLKLHIPSYMKVNLLISHVQHFMPMEVLFNNLKFQEVFQSPSTLMSSLMFKFFNAILTLLTCQYKIFLRKNNILWYQIDACTSMP